MSYGPPTAGAAVVEFFAAEVAGALVVATAVVEVVELTDAALVVDDPSLVATPPASPAASESGTSAAFCPPSDVHAEATSPRARHVPASRLRLVRIWFPPGS